MEKLIQSLSLLLIIQQLRGFPIISLPTSTLPQNPRLKFFPSVPLLAQQYERTLHSSFTGSYKNLL